MSALNDQIRYQVKALSEDNEASITDNKSSHIINVSPQRILSLISGIVSLFEPDRLFTL